MPKPTFKRVEELFHLAIARRAAERAAFLDAACAGDAELRAAVEELLEHDRVSKPSDEFLASPVAQQARQYRSLGPTILDVSQHRASAPSPRLPSIAGYELLEELGRGGMGVVYKARHLALNRIVALKMLLSVDTATTELLVRFRGEAEALARLHHPNIVAIHDIAESEGRPYFTMEYISGPSLAQVLNGRPQICADAAQLIEVVARAIHAVHLCGIIHRDLKPANILLAAFSAPQEAGGEPSDHAGLRATAKITDFGLAKDWASDRKLTKSGTAMGTPSYMAPEQASSKEGEVGPATDIYALGAVLYEMMTGRPPFDADSPAETVAQLLHDEPISPLRLRPGLPRDLVTICLKCLDKSPSKRYGSCLELAEDLRRFQAGEPILARPAGFVERAYRWGRRRPMATGFLGLALAFIVYAVVAEVRVRNALQSEVNLRAEQVIQLNIQIGYTELEAGDTFAALLRFAEAMRIDEGSEREPDHRKRIASVLAQCPTLIGMSKLDGRVICSDLGAPGGKVVTVDANHAVAVWDVSGGRQVVSGLKHQETPRVASLSADARFLGVVGVEGTATIWNLSAGPSYTLPVGKGEAVQRMVFHPDGQVLLTHHEGGKFKVWTRKIGAEAWAEIAPKPGWEQAASTAPAFACVSENGRWLFTVDARHQGRMWDVGTGKSRGEPLILEQRVRQGAVSQDGRRLALVLHDKEIAVWDMTGTQNLRRSIPVGQAIECMAFSADGEHFAYSDQMTHVCKSGAHDILAQFTHRRRAQSAEFSPDGRFLLTRHGDGGARVWDLKLQRAAAPPLNHGGGLVSAGFSGDGGHLQIVSANGLVCFWQLQMLNSETDGPGPMPAAESRSVDDLVALAQVLSASRIDNMQLRRTLDADSLLQTWQRLNAPR